MERSKTEAGRRRDRAGSPTARVRRDYAPEATDKRTSTVGLPRRTVTECSEDNLGQELNAELERGRSSPKGLARAERETQLEPRARRELTGLRNECRRHGCRKRCPEN